MDDPPTEDPSVDGTPMDPPDDLSTCFACGPANEHGLHLRFVQTGAHRAECRWEAPGWTGGAPGVIHGGLQATLLDETMGYALRTVLGPEPNMATVELALRYRRPTPTGRPLLVQAEIVEIDLPYFHVDGRIVLADAPDEPLTTATARWKALS